MHIERLFTTGSLRPQDSMRFVIAGSADEQIEPLLSVPDDWSLEAAKCFAQALCTRRPIETQIIEENTLPSWLWQRRIKGTETRSEHSILEVFDRIAGAATYRGWKLGLWSNEVEASIFFDEVHALLMTQRLILSPKDMARLGLDWAYGIKADERTDACIPAHHTNALILQNETIDSILRRTQPLATNKWDGYLKASQSKAQTHIAFADTISEWGSLPAHHNVPSAMLNLMAFRTNDGNIDHTGIEQAAKLAILLLELHHDDMTRCQDAGRPVALGLGNLAGLLMSLAIPYDSDLARGTAAALSAIVTASATITSAQLACTLGPCQGFAAGREAVLRSLRNKLRATFGEKNDYDHLSVIPQTMDLGSGVNLVLISAARYTTEEALRLVQENGLRHLQVTALYQETELAPLLDGASQGVAAEPALTTDYSTGEEQHERRISPAVMLALDVLGYDEADIKAIHDHIVGYKTLVGAPAINHATLLDKGFDEATLARVEALLPFVDHLHHAFTPWVVGIDLCMSLVGLKKEDVLNPQFDLLRAVGFTTQEIAVANAFSCGHRGVRGVMELNPKHASIFETAGAIKPEAYLHMAGAVQPFITGDTALSLTIPASLSAELRGDLVIKAWTLGLKSITLEMDAPYKAQVSAEQHMMKRKSPRFSATKETGVAPRSSRVIKHKAPSRTVALKSSEGDKSPMRTKRG